MMQFLLARHMFMHFSYMRTLSFLPILFWIVMLCLSVSLSLSLSLSLSRIDCAWHPSAKPLRLETLFVPGHLLLILPLLTFGFVMGRPIRTSWRTSPNMVFIQNATWFYQTFPILLYPLSFTVKDMNLYVRYP